MKQEAVKQYILAQKLQRLWIFASRRYDCLLQFYILKI